MSQNQSYFWQTTRHNVYLKRTAKLHMWLALMAILTFATICTAEVAPRMNENNGIANNRLMRAADEPTTLTNVKSDDFGVTNDIPDTDEPKHTSKAGFVDAFTASISVIILTELGDKTFFIAAIMAMRHPRVIVFSGAIFALALMTVISCVFGMAATIIPKGYTYYISIALFAIFGIKMLYDGYNMKDTDAQEELEEVQSDLRKREDELLRKTARKYVDDNDIKRKNSNSDKDSDAGAGADDALIEQQQQRNHHGIICSSTTSLTASTTTTPTSIATAAAAAAAAAINNNNNHSEMQHRQRKQRNGNKKYNKNNCDIGTAELVSGKRRDSEVYLTKDGAIVELKTLNTSLSLASLQQTQQNQQNITCDSPTLNNLNGEVLVHTPATAGQMNKKLIYNNNDDIDIDDDNDKMARAPIAAGESVNNLDDMLDGTFMVSNSNGDLKQRLDRDVNAALVKDPESGIIRRMKRKSNTYLSTRIFVQAFTMTFLAEWGDRSQLTTIILAASKNVYGVIIGGILGHSICTGLAVIGGRIVAAKISVRTVTIVGGIVFIGFAAYGLLMPPDDL